MDEHVHRRRELGTSQLVDRHDERGKGHEPGLAVHEMGELAEGLQVVAALRLRPDVAHHLDPAGVEVARPRWP